MAKLYLKFEQQTLKEVPAGQNTVITIGRLPDNSLQIDNLAVSGHHAKIYWDADRYVVEDTQSLNGTYVNNQRIGKQPLKDNDAILIGKHTILFKDEWHEDAPGDKAKAAVVPALPKMEATVVLDTKKAKEMLAQARAASAGGAAAEPAAHAEASAAGRASAPAAAAKHRMGVMTILEGKADDSRYMLSSKLTVVGGSKMATIKLKGGLFSHPPDVAAMISKREDKYYVAPQDAKGHVRVNGADISAQHELNEGDVVQVWKVKMAFSWHE